MRVKVIVKGSLKKYIINNKTYFDIQEGYKISEAEKILKEKIGIPSKIPTYTIVDQRKISKDYILKENDTIIFVSLIGGG